MAHGTDSKHDDKTPEDADDSEPTSAAQDESEILEGDEGEPFSTNDQRSS